MITISQATIDDIELIYDMASITFPLTYGDIISESQIKFMMEWMYSLENQRKQIEEEGHIYYIAYFDNTPAGYLSIQQEGEDLFHLQKLYVLPEFKGKKIGKMLWLKAVEEIKRLHPSPCSMHLNVNRGNTNSIAFYYHMGMHKVKEGDFHIGNGYYMNDFIMGLDIK